MPVIELAPLPPVSDQVERLARLGLGVADDTAAHRLPDVLGALVAIRHDVVPAAQLAALLTHRGKPGFVVADMDDVADFVPTGVDLPGSALYLVTGLDRGDDMRGWTPAEALAELDTRGRSPLTIHEGLSWLLQQPEALADNHCFMTIGSRKPKATGYDARTPAIWISRGTGRDGTERRNAPKLGWCWWNNRHTWLGFGSCAGRTPAEAG